MVRLKPILIMLAITKTSTDNEARFSSISFTMISPYYLPVIECVICPVARSAFHSDDELAFTCQF
jgi:hypothetical protein